MESGNVEKDIYELVKVQLLKDRVNGTLDDIAVVELFKLVGLSMFSDIVSLVGGKTIKIPTKEEFKEIFGVSVIYFYKAMGKTLPEIKEIFDGSNFKVDELKSKVTVFENYIKDVSSNGV